LRSAMTMKVTDAAAVLGKNIWGSVPSSFSRQQQLSEITINYYRTNQKFGGRLGKIWGACAPWPQTRTTTDDDVIERHIPPAWRYVVSTSTTIHLIQFDTHDDDLMIN